MIGIVIVLGTSIWVLVDAKTIGVKKGQLQGILDMGPWGWFFSCLLIWIVGFPLYLAKRGQFKRLQSVGQSTVSVGDYIEKLEKLSALRDKQLITEEEFTQKKKELEPKASAENNQEKRNSGTTGRGAGIAIASIFIIFVLGIAIPAYNDPLDDIWNAYTNYPGNSSAGTRWTDVKGKLIKQGTVPPSAVNSSAKKRLPAYLACYDYVMILPGLGDQESNLCVYYIDNQERGTYSIMWRGKQYISQLESEMASDGFISN